MPKMPPLPLSQRGVLKKALRMKTVRARKALKVKMETKTQLKIKAACLDSETQGYFIWTRSTFLESVKS